MFEFEKKKKKCLTIILQIIPRNLIFAHSAKITALTKAADGWDNQSSIISAADNG